MSSEAMLTADKPARKQQKRSVITQHKLLDAAIEAFSENGFKGTSTRDIAERAGVHHPLITYHFKNKDELWRAATDRAFRQFRGALASSLESLQDKCAKDRMASIIKVYLNYSKNQPSLHKVMVQEASHPNPRLDWLIENHLRPLFDVTFAMIEELQRKGVAPQGNPRLLLNMIRMSSGGMLALGNELKTSSDIDIDEDGMLDEIAEMIVNVFLPGECPEDD